MVIMVLDSLGDSVQGAVDRLRNTSGSLTEEDIDPVVKEIQRALLEGDAEVEIVMDMSDTIKERALGEDAPGGVTVREHVLNIVYEEMKSVIGGSTDIPLENQTVLLAGLQGAGKTTSAAKIAWWFSKKGLKPSVIQTDTFRPGAHKQLEQLASESDIAHHTDADADDPVQIAEAGLEKTDDTDVTIVDTAGRHASEDDLINEIQEISRTVNPDLNLLVIDAAMGQAAREQAERFNETIGIDGVVITKMDGTAKGGGALTAVNAADASVAFLGNGETVRDIERFEPDGFISRLLGMGDLKQLSERVERAMHESGDDDWEPEDIFEGEFTMHDMRKQMETMNQMGALDEVMNMIPGMGSGLMSQIDDDMLDLQEERMREFQIVMDSMTENELSDPSIVKKSRKKRIARGSGVDESVVEELFTQYEQMNQFLGQMGSRGDLKQMVGDMDISDMMGGGPF